MTTASQNFIKNIKNIETALNRSFLVTANYHSRYEDDDAEIYFYNPITRKFSKSEWTTRFACGGYPISGDEIMVTDLIEAGLIDKEQFIDDLIAEYGYGSCGNGLYISGYPRDYAWGAVCGFPIILKGRKYNGKATLIAMHKGWTSKYGRVESFKYEFITEDGKYYNNVSPSFDWDTDTYKKQIIEKLHKADPSIAIDYILPWNEASIWKMWPITCPENLKELRENYNHEQMIKKFDKKRDFLESKTQDLWEWANNKFAANMGEEFMMNNVKRCLRKYYDVKDEAYLNDLCSTIKK